MSLLVCLLEISFVRFLPQEDNVYIVVFVRVKSLCILCVTESVSWLPGATVGPETYAGYRSDAGSSSHHHCSETTSQNAH